MGLPALLALEAAGYRLTLLGKPWARELFEGHGWPFIGLGASLRDTLRTLRGWRRQHRKAAVGVLLPNSFSSGLAFRLAGLPSAGLSTDGRGVLLRWRVPEPPSTHEVKRFFSVAQGVLRAWTGTAPAEAPPVLGLKLAAAHRQAAQEALAGQGVTGPYVVLAPLAVGLHHGRPKHWDGFAALGDWLAQEGHQVVACPPPGEVDATRAALPRATLLPSMHLGCFAAVLAGSRLVVANDSGASHVAAAVGAAQITVHGVTDPARTGPWSPAALALGSEHGWPAFDEVRAAARAVLAAA
jgi:heptosyltransferase-2